MRWYCQTLHLKGYLYPRKEPFTYASVRSDDLHMGFVLIDPAGDLHWDPDAPVGRIEPEVVDIDVEDVESLHRRLSERVAIHTPLSRGPDGSLRFGIEDPDRHLLVFHEASERQPACE